MAACLEWAATIRCADAGRLAEAERLVATWPLVLRGAIRDCDLAFEAGGAFVAVLRLSGNASESRRRLAYWCARAGAELTAVDELAEAERIALRTRVAMAGQVARAVAGDALALTAHRFFTACGAPEGRRRAPSRPVLAFAAGALADLRWDGEDRRVFVPSDQSPMPGDELQVVVPDGRGGALECRASVRDVRSPEAASPGLPAGFSLALASPPPALVSALEEACAQAAASPAEREPASAAHAPRPDVPGGSARRALVVDDDALARRVLGDALAEIGFEVATASGGEDGLQRIAADDGGLALLVTDLRMPDLDGATFVRAVRRGGETGLAVVVVTGSLEPGVEPQLERAGADAVLDKALGAAIIARAADAVVARKRQGA